MRKAKLQIIRTSVVDLLERVEYVVPVDSSHAENPVLIHKGVVIVEMQSFYALAAHADNVCGRWLTVALGLVGVSRVNADSVVVGKLAVIVSRNAIIAIDKFVSLAEKIAAGVSYGVAEGLGGKYYIMLFSKGESADELIVVQVSHEIGIGIAAHIDARCCMYDAYRRSERLCCEDIAANVFYHYIIFIFDVLEARALSVRLTYDEPEGAGVITERLEVLEYLLVALAVDRVGISTVEEPTIHKAEVYSFGSHLARDADSLLVAVNVLQSVYR